MDPLLPAAVSPQFISKEVLCVFCKGRRRPPLFFGGVEFLFPRSLSPTVELFLSLSLSLSLPRWLILCFYIISFSLSLMSKGGQIEGENEDKRDECLNSTRKEFEVSLLHLGVTRSAIPTVDANARSPDLPALASDLLSAKAA